MSHPPARRLHAPRPKQRAAVLVVLEAVSRDAGAIRRRARGPSSSRLLRSFTSAARQLDRPLEEAVGQVRQVLLDGPRCPGTDRPCRSRARCPCRRSASRRRSRRGSAALKSWSERRSARRPQMFVLPPSSARAHPGVVRPGVRVILLVDDDVLAVVGAAPPLHVRVHVLVLRCPWRTGACRIVVLVER